MILGIKLFVVTLVALGSTLSVAPSHVAPVLSVKPVHVQHFSQLTEPSDLQPALGYRVLQDTASPQPNVGFGVQNVATTNLYQRTTSPQE